MLHQEKEPISDIHGDISYRLPTLEECWDIPQDIKEILTSEVAQQGEGVRVKLKQTS